VNPLRGALISLFVSVGVACLSVVWAASPSSAATRPASPAPSSGSLSPTILIGTGGLTWSDVSAGATPALWSLLRDGSSAALSIQSVFINTCPVDGWLTMSAGNRAAAPGPGSDGSRTAGDPCAPLPAVTNGAVPGWDGYLKAAAATKFDSRLGTLGDQLASSGQCIQAVGPGAGLAAATTSGAVPRYAAFDPARLPGLLSGCRVTLVDVGSLRDPADVAPGETVPADSRSVQLRAIDARIGQVMAAAPQGSNLMVASVADAGRTERLGLVAAKGPDFASGTLWSSSTRQSGLAQLADLTVTLLAAGRAPVPAALGGATLKAQAGDGSSVAAASSRLQALVDEDQASHEVHALVPPFFDWLVGSQLAVYLLAALFWRRKYGSTQLRGRVLRVVRDVALVAAAVPVSTFLANLFPWWRFQPPMVSVVASVAVFAAVLWAVARLGPWRRVVSGPMAVISLATLLVLSVDVLLGSHLQMSSLLGLQPVVGGRFYGVGNVTFALLATAAVLLAVAISGRYVARGRSRVGAVWVIAIGVVALVVDGAPWWGADGGGPPALLPGLAYLVLTILGVRMTWKRGLLVSVATVVLFLLVGFLDWLRPAQSRSHLGRFIQSMIDGGAWDIVSRKLDANVAILQSSPLAALVPVALVCAIYLLARPSSWASRVLQRSYDACPTLRPGLIALLVTLTIGFAINDSGVAIPANGAVLAMPLLIALSLSVLEVETRAGAAVEPADLPAPRRRRGTASPGEAGLASRPR
jgi:hypothetical protein